MGLDIDAFDTRSIDAAIKQLRTLQAKLDAAPEKAAEKAADRAATIVAQNLIGIPDYDGNSPGDVFNNKSGQGERLVGMTGEQVEFLEYGTGVVGQTSQKPDGMNIPADWAYNTGTHIHNNHWVYNDMRHGGWPTMTSGIPAYAPVYNAKVQLEEEIPEIVAEVLK